MVSLQARVMIAIQGARLVLTAAPLIVFSAILGINFNQITHAQNVKRFKASSLMKSFNAKRYVEMAYSSILLAMMATKRVGMDVVRHAKLNMDMHAQLQIPHAKISYPLLSKKL